MALEHALKGGAFSTTAKTESGDIRLGVRLRVEIFLPDGPTSNELLSHDLAYLALRLTT